jgi:hypothetical protein
MNVKPLRMALWGEGVLVHAMKAFLATTLDGGELSASCPGNSASWERAPGTYWIDGWWDP